MFSRVFVAALLALPMIASATPTPNNPSGGNCNAGEIHCCDQTMSLGNVLSNPGGLLSLGASVVPLLGLNCNPISIIGAGGNSCTSQPVCCEHASSSGSLNLFNCSPLNVNL